MALLIVNQAEVRALLPMSDCIDVMAETLMALSRGEAVLPLRSMMRLPDSDNALLLMPAYQSSIARMGVKIIGLFPGNAGTEWDSHPGAVLLFDGQNGQLLALIDASEVTAIRTAAVSGAATRALANSEAGDLAILGAGVQARSHLEAMVAVRPIRRVRVYSPHNAGEFVQRESVRYPIPIEIAASAEEAVADADIICTCTASSTPVVRGEWIKPGAHINAVGAYTASTREL
ncbi:MAG: ornithine cyclodeaminase family protein, partial [Anaerolineae bacterium]|nr:ornithine cyclodeaminase family protein [Anaerolineae bacterium]